MGGGGKRGGYTDYMASDYLATPGKTSAPENCLMKCIKTFTYTFWYNVIVAGDNLEK